MPNPDHETLGQIFTALQEERARSWAPEQLAKSQAQRLALIAAFDPDRIVRVGEAVDKATLRDTAGGEINLDQLTADGPAVLLFVRYADCPADNLALPHYDRRLSPKLAAANIPLVAISPQLPERLAAIRERHDLRLTVASDPDNRLARRLGLTFMPIEMPSPPPAGWIGEITGTGTWELPQTAAIILDKGRIVRFVSVNPDWLNRIEPSEILSVLASIGALEPVAELEGAR